MVEDERSKFEALKAFTEHVVPGRWQDVRQPNKKELKGTLVLSLTLEEASAKIRTGDPVDDNEDYQLNVWAGVIPLKLTAGKPIADHLLRDEIGTPQYILNQKRFVN